MSTIIQFERGGTLYHTMVDVPHNGARWAASPAPTVALYGSDGGIIRAAATATEGPTTTLAATAAVGATSLTVAATTSIRRFSRLLVGPNTAGQWEWVTVDGATGTTVTILDTLQHAYAIGNTVKSHDLSTTVTTSEASVLARHARAEWVYTVDGITRAESTEYMVCRYAPRISVTAADVLQHDPRVRKYIGPDQRIETLLRQLWETRVIPDLVKIYGTPGAVVSGETLGAALIAKLDEYVARKTGAEEAEIRYSETYAELLDEIRLSMIDANEDGAEELDVQRTVRVGRLWRG